MDNRLAWVAGLCAALSSAHIPPAAGEAASAYAQSSPSRDQIIENLQKRYSARVLRIETLSIDGREVYEVRLLAGERVFMVRVDATTGRELERP